MRGIIPSTVIVLALAGSAMAQGVVQVSADITTSTIWTANNVYDLTTQVYVRPGATLTIEAGTVIASTVTANGSGSLAVTKGAMINIQGTQSNPVIMTSSADRATWVGGDPKTGTWREEANEWGNLTIMGDAFISENATPGNVSTCSASNVGTMEGLTAAFPGDSRVLYGGGDDNDDSGSISFLSIRYGGRVVGLNNELNGLSLGGIGRGTDIHHVEVMNNVDDGIEIWGGTFNLSHFSIWNVGDDSLDIDQGYRGKVQHGLIVQGYSLDASQGSGVGDNAIETDGAEDSDWQPVTTTTMHNLTVIGQPIDGDGLTAWRDNARVQYRNCIFMDAGEAVVRFDNDDGDGANGYGHNGTLSWAATWTTPAGAAPAHPNDCPAGTYTAQSSGNLSEVKDSVFFRNLNPAAYTEANARGVFASGNNNVLVPGFDPAAAPIKDIQRPTMPVTRGGRLMLPVTSLNPLPQNQALTSVDVAPADGFFNAVRYRGAFAPDANWLLGWTASQAFGFTPAEAGSWTDLAVGNGEAGTRGAPTVGGQGNIQGPSSVTVRNCAPGAQGALFVGVGRLDFPFLGGVLVPQQIIAPVNFTANAQGEFSFPFSANLPSGIELVFQAWVADPSAPSFIVASNGLSGTSGT